MPGKGTSDDVLILRWLLEVCCAKGKRLYRCVVGVKKAFDRILR